MRYLSKVTNNFLKICVNGLLPGFDLLAGRRRKGYGYFLVSMYASVWGLLIYAASAGTGILGSVPRLLLFMFSFVYLCVVSLVGVCLTHRYRYPHMTKSIVFSKIFLMSVLLSLAGGSVYVISPYVYAVDEIFTMSPMPYVEQYIPTHENGETRGEPANRHNNRLNILLIGSDADIDRYGVRTDSLNVVSVDTETLDATIIGIPRNLTNAPLPESLENQYFPEGYGNLINTLYWWGERNPAAVNSAIGGGDRPGAALLSYSIATLLGMPLDAWIMVDMGGFINVIDAAGGMQVYVDKDLAVPGPVSGSKGLITSLNKGWHYMDGTNALSFARSRQSDSDYWRMGRQRCLLASLVAQKDLTDILLRWPAIALVLGTNVQTNLDPDVMSTLVGLAGADTGGIKFLSLVPPLVPRDAWDGEYIKKLVYGAVYDVPYTELFEISSATPASSVAPSFDDESREPVATVTPEGENLVEAEDTTSTTATTTAATTTTTTPVKTAGQVCRLKP